MREKCSAICYYRTTNRTVSNRYTSSSYSCLAVDVLHMLLYQGDLSVLFSRYAQAMLRKIYNGTVSPGTNGSTADSPEHNCLSWLAPPGQLEGPIETVLDLSEQL